ncbi:MAG: hypothetical protein ACOYYJ_19245 [Chloroflexota bacterium]
MAAPLKKSIALFSLALFAVGLGLFAWLGVYSRYWADDWCYNANLKDLGFWGFMQGYTYITTYASNRFSLTLFSAFLQAFAIPGLQWMTFGTIALWTSGLAVFLRNLRRIEGDARSSFPPVLLALLSVYFTLYLAPHLYQSVYWRSGFLPYTAPLVFTVWVFALLTQQAVSEKPSLPLAALTGLLSLLAGGFSEAGCAFLVAALGLYVLLAGIGYLHRSPWAVKSLPGAGAALLFALLAMALLVYSPTSQVRVARYGAAAGIVELIALLARFTYTFFAASLKDYQHLLIFAMAALSGFLLAPPRERGLGGRAWLAAVLALAGLALALVAAALAPSAYIEKGLPALRAQIIPRFVVILALASAGWTTGEALQGFQILKWLPAHLHNLRNLWIPSLAVLLLLLSHAWTVYSISATAGKIDLYSKRAQAWDQRDAVIRLEAATTATSVIVPAIDGAPVGGIRDLDPPEKSGFWITKCAERFYGVKIKVIFP